MTEEGDYPQSTSWNSVPIKRNYYLAVDKATFLHLVKSFHLEFFLAHTIHWIRFSKYDENRIVEARESKLLKTVNHLERRGPGAFSRKAKF